MRPLFQENKINITETLEDIKNQRFDITHVHHMINAFEVRYYFPNLPIIYLSHGVTHVLEQAPFLDLKISKFLAVSEEVKENLVKQDIDKNQITIFRNIVDKELFYPKKPINKFPRKALVISQKINQRGEEIIKKACKKLKIKPIFIGGRFGVINYKQIPDYINEADIVFSLGRGVIEAIFCGRIPLVYDRFGGDGLVTSKNIKNIMKCNFFGKLYKKYYDVNELINEIKKYNQEDGKILRKIALNYFDAEINMKKIIKIYEEKSKEKIDQLDSKTFNKIKTFIELINQTQTYTYIKLTRFNLEKIQSSKTYKIWQEYCKIRDKILRKLGIKRKNER